MAQQDQTNVCRVCLQSDIVKKKKGLSLFQKYKDSLIYELINSIANVEIKENDGLPSKICPGCLIELEVAVNFRLKCQTSNTILHKKNDNSESENNVIKIEYNLADIKEEKYEEELPITVETEYIEDDFIDDTGVTVKAEEKPSRAVDLKLICDDCKGSFPSKCKLSVHWKKVHMCQNLICQICKRVFKSYRAFHRHVKLKLRTCLDMGNVNIEGLGKTRRYCCKECPYTSKRTKDMQTHLVLHSGEKPFKCSLCDTYFTQQSSKQDHMERVHGEYRKEITCQYCGKFVRGRAAAYKHLRWHTLVRVQCDVCKKFFKNKRVLKIPQICIH